MRKVNPFLRLMRPANIATAIADVLAGVAIAGRFESGLDKTWVHILLLCASTLFLYAGGSVYQDVFNADTDALRHPDRPIPIGLVTPAQAKAFGFILFVTGIVLAGTGSLQAGLIAIGITFFSILYSKWGIHSTILGPLNMGICRGLTLILGLSMVPFELQHWFFLALVPVVYIYAIALIRKGGGYGNKKQNLNLGVFLYLVVMGAILYQANINGELDYAALFLIPFALIIFIPLSNAIKYPDESNIGKAVRSGILAFTLMDAAWAITFDSWLAAVIIACLFPIAMWLSKAYPVT